MKNKKFCALIEIIRRCEEVFKLDSMDKHEKMKILHHLMDERKENQDLILVMHKDALNRTLLATIEIFSIYFLKIKKKFIKH
jgi:hypothetical protein